MAESIKTCSYPECDHEVEPHSARGYCNAHYLQWKKFGPDGLRPVKRRNKGKPCTFPGCPNNLLALGYCSGHYQQYKNGKEMKALTRNRDFEDRWVIQPDGYVRQLVWDEQKGHTTSLYQHRYVMEQHLNRKLVPGENIHHINGDRSDNRIENLELWSSSQPQGQRIEDKLTWAREILSFYGDHSYT